MAKAGGKIAMPGMIPGGIGGGSKPLSRIMFDKYDTLHSGHINANGFQR